MINGFVVQGMRGTINYSNFKPVKPKKLYDVNIQNAIVSTMNLTVYKDTIYSRALSEVNDIISLINR